MHHILWLGIGDQHVVLTSIPHISKSRPMKHETTLPHEIRDFLSRGRFAEENRLTGHDAGISSGAVKTMNLPIEAKKLHREPDTLEVLIQRRKPVWAKKSAKLTGMSGFDDPTIVRKPNLVLRASGLSKTRWKLDLVHPRDFQNLRQKGRLDSVSRPTFSNSFTCSSQASRVTVGCSRTIRAKRSRSAWQISSMLASPADMS